MGLTKQDPEYLRAKYAFIRDLIQFHESRGTGLNCDPKINGKEVDLYLLYQIVTSHGGWEKINLRNEWDKLLEHFHLPRSTNGGLAIKQIYLRYLELYEKIHFLGEDIDAKEDHDDDYEDFRGRRRYPNTFSSRHSSHHHHSSSSHHGHGHHHNNHPKEIADHNRSQLGLSTRILETSDYEGLLLSLQSPLPNEQDMAISVCTLLSNETKHVLRFSKSPAILNMLLAHAGIYQDCGMRVLMEETYREARNLNHAEFWDEVLHHPDVRQLLCECFTRGAHSTLGLLDDEGAILSQLQEVTDGNLSNEEKYALGTVLRLRLAHIRESRELENPTPTPKTELLGSQALDPCPSAPPPSSDKVEPTSLSTGEAPVTETADEVIVEARGEEISSTQTTTSIVDASTPGVDQRNKDVSNENADKNLADVKQDDSISCMEISFEEDKSCEAELVNDSVPAFCCSTCPCQRTIVPSLSVSENECNDDDNSCDQFSIERRLRLRPKRKATLSKDGDSPVTSFLLTKEAQEKVGQRIYQIAHILRNLSFEQDNAFVMARSPTLMRFLLIAANCSFGSLAQASFDIIGNIASHIQLDDPLENPLSSMFLSLVTSGIFSEDRFKILRSLEALRELTKMDGNEGVISRYVENRVYERICDLLTLSDIMLLIYTLECILSMTGMGEAVCDEIVRVQGSVATLVSLVTVEAQSYGPKGCIQMRVVETVTGGVQQPTETSSTSTTSTATSSTVSSTATSVTSLSSIPHQQPQIHVPPTQHLLQQQLQQPPNPIYAASTSSQVVPSRPSPASSPGMKIVTGTTTVVPPVAQGQHGLVSQQQQQHQQQAMQKSGVVGPSPANSQVFGTTTTTTTSATSTNIQNHHNSSTQQVPTQPVSVQGPAIIQSPSVLPSSSISQPMIKTPPMGNCSNGTIVTGVPQGVQLPPPGATVVMQQPTSAINPPGGAPVAGSAINGAPTLITANLPQISNHSLSQHHHVVTPSISLVTPRGTLSEEAWAIAWLKGTFESSSGTSIEQGEIYRMYSAARKNPNLVLSLEQFVQCVKCAYGGNVGPVIKQFGGGTSLSFFEGIKPKISIRAVAVTSAPQVPLKVGATGSNPATVAEVTTSVTLPVTNTVVQVPMSTGAVLTTSTVIQTTTPHPQVTTTKGEGDVTKTDQSHVNNNNNNENSNSSNAGATGATLSVSVHIPSREAKASLSPILQATLSQPPKTKNNTNATGGSKRAKSHKGKEKQGSKTEASAENLCTKFSSSSLVGVSSKGKITLSPASSAIRSLLASKVAQRQQNKLQQQLPKSAKGKLNDKINSTANAVSKEDCQSGVPRIVKVNGVGPDGLIDKAEESSASSSVLSSDGSENISSNKSVVPITSFHGVLHNGQAILDSSKNDLSLEDLDDPETLKNRGNMKGMLIDLLERRVPSREPVNGVTIGREIRISEKGRLELIDKMEETLGGSGVVNHSGNTSTSTEEPESQKMTFYSSTSDAQVTLQGQAPTSACVLPASAVGPALTSSAVTLASGASPVSSNVLKGGGIAARQQVKLCGGNIVRVIEQGVDLPATAAVPMATPAVFAEVEVDSTEAALAPAFSIGDGLATSSASATNGAITYVMSDSLPSSTVLVDVDSVIATSHSAAPLVLDHNVVVVDGETMIVDGETMIVDGETVIVDGEVTSTGCIDVVDIVGVGSVNNDDGCGGGASTVEPTESFFSNGGGVEGNNHGDDGGDLLEQFSQFSDLIVVPPEQLASLKRPSSPLSAEQNLTNPVKEDISDDLPPPAKKLALDSSLMEANNTTNDSNATTDAPGFQLDSANSQSLVNVPIATSAGSASVLPQTAVSTACNSVPVSNTAGTTVVTSSTPSLPPGAGAQVVQLPLRLSVNPQNPQQLTFTRQLVLPSGQQVLLSTGNSQPSLQGQVILSKSQVNTTDQLPKAIIILQQTQQQQQQQQQQQVGNVQGVTQNATVVQGGSVLHQQQQPSLPHPVNHQQVTPAQAALNPNSLANTPTMTSQVVGVQQQIVQQPVQRISAPIAGPTQVQKAPVQNPQQVQPPIPMQVNNTQQQPSVIQQQQIPQHALTHPQHAPNQKPVNLIQFEGIKASSYPHLTPEQLDMEFPFVCEWHGCGLRFLKPHQVSMHALRSHCPESMVDAVRCEWGQTGCDPLLRKRFSLMTHLQDRHCSKQALEMALYRRKNRIDPPPVPQQPLHHPGYAPNAAFHAIKRHAMTFMSTKENLTDDNEGPVTKSIRLTSALILRNLVNYSALGRKILQGYESHLSGIAMSNVESSRTIAQLLHDMNERPKSSK